MNDPSFIADVIGKLGVPIALLIFVAYAARQYLANEQVKQEAREKAMGERLDKRETFITETLIRLMEQNAVFGRECKTALEQNTAAFKELADAMMEKARS